MQTRRVGNSGLTLSALSLGTLTWGRDTDEHEAKSLLDTYIEAGGRSLDIPSDFRSESFAGRVSLIGNLLNGHFDRADLTLTLHSGSLPETPSRPSGGLGARPRSTTNLPMSRGNLLQSLDEALRDLGSDFVDLWVVHGPRQGIPHEEIVSSLEIAVRSGKASYVGLAEIDAWDMGAVTTLAKSSGIAVSAVAGPLSLLEAAALTSLLDRGAEQGLGYVAWAPLARGVLTGKYRHSTPPDSRAASAHLGGFVKPLLGAEQSRIVEAICRAADGLGVPPARLALSWSLDQRQVSTVVVGPRTARQLESLLEGEQIRLQRELRDVLAEIAMR